jgi:aminopeptidase N
MLKRQVHGQERPGDGFTQWNWHVQLSDNSYNVSINATEYVTFADKLGDVTLDFYVTPENLDKAKTQFAQATPMIEAFKHYFGEYPFASGRLQADRGAVHGHGAPERGDVRQRLRNGYGGRDWTGVGISPKFDFIIIHESGHEWFGNAVSSADVSDMWIQEGWCTYLEGMYVEKMYGYADAIKYLNGYKSKIQLRTPIVTHARHPPIAAGQRPSTSRCALPEHASKHRR